MLDVVEQQQQGLLNQGSLKAVGQRRQGAIWQTQCCSDGNWHLFGIVQMRERDEARAARKA
jgi:hypothetical protein